MCKKKSTVVKVHEPLMSRLRQIKKDTGKPISRIIQEALKVGFAVMKNQLQWVSDE